MLRAPLFLFPFPVPVTFAAFSRVAGALVVLGLARTASAQTEPASARPSTTDGTPTPTASAPATPTKVRVVEDEPTDERHAGFEGGARLGAGIPFGKVDGGSDPLSDVITATVPIWLDAGFRVNGAFYVGVYGLLAPAITNSGKCKDCSGANYRIGINAHYHFLPEGSFDPWIGFGAGYEVISLSQKTTATGNNLELSATGWEVANLQVGGDIKLSDLVRLGPFVSLSFDVTTAESLTVGANTIKATDIDTRFRQWLTFGARVVFNP